MFAVRPLQVLLTLLLSLSSLSSLSSLLSLLSLSSSLLLHDRPSGKVYAPARRTRPTLEIPP